MLCLQFKVFTCLQEICIYQIKLPLGLLFIQEILGGRGEPKTLAFPWKVQRELAFGRTGYLKRTTTVLVDLRTRITMTMIDLAATTIRWSRNFATTIVGVSCNRNIATIFIDISSYRAIDQNHHAYIKKQSTRAMTSC